MSQLPVLISIPHGGRTIPPEIADKVCLSPLDLFEDGDGFTREIYGIKNEVMAFIEMDIARAFIDLNREAHDRPPENPDGIYKTRTCHGKPVYFERDFPDIETFEEMIVKYHAPYHAMIAQLIETTPDLKLALDCHSMEPVGPAISPDEGKERPLICLGNRNGESCPQEWVEQLAECLQKSFDLSPGDVTINQPFAGGHITRLYGNKPLPWIQVEMNRKLYLSEPWFDRETLEIDHARLDALRTSFKKGLDMFWSL